MTRLKHDCTAQDAIDDCIKLAHYLDGYAESEEPVYHIHN